MIVVAIQGGVNNWREGRVVFEVILETSAVKCAACGRPMPAPMRATFTHEPPARAVITHVASSRRCL